MTLRQHRLLIILLAVTAALFVSFALQSMRDLGWHAAHAQGALAPADAAATVSLSLLASLYHSGAYIPLAIMVAFYGVRFAGAHVKRPNIAHWLAIAAGVLALFVPAATQGTTPNAAMLIGFIAPALALIAPGLTPKQGS